MTTGKSRAPNGASTIYQGSDGSWHGRITMGTRDDGKPDRRHVRGRTKADVRRKLRELERAREDGTVRRPGRPWAVEQWLTHWVDNIAAPSIRSSSLSAYRVAIRVHLIPGVGGHRIDRLEPEHLERLYLRMMKNGSSAGTAHQVHRTARAALNEAVRRGHITKNPAALAKAPRLTESEIEPYSVDEVQRILETAAERRNAARWAIALALGLRQGEALGLRWSDTDLDSGALTCGAAGRGRSTSTGAVGSADAGGPDTAHSASRRRRMLTTRSRQAESASLACPTSW